MSQKKRILYVEDEPDFAGAVRFILENKRYEFDVAKYRANKK